MNVKKNINPLLNIPIGYIPAGSTNDFASSLNLSSGIVKAAQDIVNEVMKLPLGSKLMLLAPVVSSKKGEFLHIPEQYSAKGFSRVRVDGIIYALDEFPELNKNERHDIEIVVDRFVLSPELRTRISGSIEQALELGQGIIQLLKIKDTSTAVGESRISSDNTEILVYSQRYACPEKDCVLYNSVDFVKYSIALS